MVNKHSLPTSEGLSPAAPSSWPGVTRLQDEDSLLSPSVHNTEELCATGGAKLGGSLLLHRTHKSKICPKSKEQETS